MEQLFKMFNDIRPLGDELQAHILSILKQREIKRGDLLLKKGHICKTMSFLQSGLLHCYSFENGKKITTWFLQEKKLAISPKSFYTQTPTEQEIAAFEPCELYFITYDELQNIYNAFPEFNYHGRILTEVYYMLKDEHTNQLLKGTIKQRYDWFIHTFPDLITRVPFRYIATFLGVTEETLSRIRSKKP